MILFMILALTVLILTAFVIAAISVGGAAFILVFGDVIVCAVLIIFMIKRLIKNKNNKRRKK